ncbi:DotU family type IV/VI secretion system protein [Burkholderia sp. Ac-20344]|uniref:DotU family type IV/VI secretion system protein n=1 Tax=Burkholderia sp. Ac-20344 TaxID=2703890 RepID=UPI00197B57FB|nr:DotU family type IV/VI secretion system protein [Burkholderia sp. Ac-20344]MBN3830780.1 DotU family type IV/VI secretion system protein [Burkholderia sp. Ac-20344]
MMTMTIPCSTLLPVALRDTARIVTALSKGSLSFETARERSNAQFANLREELSGRELPDDVIDDALYSHCALIDEAALKYLTGNARDAWAHEPLQVMHFASNDAGTELVRRIEHRLREPQPVRPLLAIFAAVFELGFVGRFAGDSDTARVALTHAINQRLGRATAEESGRTSFAPIVIDRTRAARFRLSILSWVTVACIATGLAWFVVDRWLIAAIAQLAQ